MFSIAHIVIIFVVALVVFGPEKLPDLARNLGKVMGEFRRATGDLRSTFEGHMRDLEREADLRKVRETQAAVAKTTASPASPAPGAATEASVVGGGDLMTPLPVSTPEASATVDPADGFKDQAPPPGTVQSQRPNAIASAEPAVAQQLSFEAQQLHAGERPESGSEKASDVRSRPA